MVTRNRRRETEWFSIEQGFVNLAASAQASVPLFNATQVGARFIKGTTITRQIINIWMKPDTVGEFISGFWGIVIMNADAVAAGGFPEADDMSDRPDWMVRGQLQGIMSGLSDSAQWSRTELDLRSQRIMRSEEDDLRFIIDNFSATTAFDFSIFIRTLVKWA